MLVILLLSLLLLLIGRILFVIVNILIKRTQYNKHVCSNKIKTAIVIGSGGHTAEILRLMRCLNPSVYSPRIYIVASSDSSSETKILSMEEALANKLNRDLKEAEFKIVKIPRSRSVSQSYFTSVFTTLHSFCVCVPIMWALRPKLLLCNGPGTCIPICIISFLMNVMFISDTYTVFVESVCRVNTLSLSGKILYYVVDEFFVQWKELHEKYKRSKYFGRLV
ncbi:UDP-N-acetylglucosamine transferase subunit ALG14 homolog [Schistocerca americana]|uniref:UDP-N-acetylglucosamine transferase subunit ALG14 homolog n=1 Tax=Schistocerca americana TaxID=7009 RepID=UPI001F4F361C|nr:UDP-N-acetylglucosamine transferase subunit ALG14 homolog [Schistocerca americana]XP_047109892.1 UDP-N-acetylglucosamine transferase subunit ALG14 homolog [Schistocerca piceifrons]